MNTSSIQSTVTMEQAIRSAITAAVHQVKSKMYERDPEDPVQAFLDDLFAVLFPTSAPAPVVEAAAPAPKEKKPRKKKTDSPAPVPEVTVSAPAVEAPAPAVEETPAPAPAPAKEKKPRKKKADSPAAPATEAPAVEETPAAPAKEKKPRKKKADSPAAPAPAAVTPPTAPAATEAPAAPKKEKKPKSPKPEGVNLDKLTPTQVKKLKAVADELHVELDKKAFLNHLNAMSGPVFSATTLESHYRTFLQPAATPVVEEQVKDLDAVEVEFNGKTYYVDESDMRVYEQQGEVFAPVGYVGMAAFKDLVLPQDS